MMRSQLLLLGMAAMVLVGLTGCGGGGSTSKVTGTVKLKDGRLVTTGKILFTGGPGNANGQIQKDGSFTVGTYKVDDGAKPATYTVVIVGALEPDNRSQEDIYAGKGQAPKPLIHAKYEDAKTSDLKVEVKAGRNKFDLQLDPVAGAK